MALRVLHVISSLDPRGGGPVAALAGLAPAQHAAGASVRVLYTWRRGEDRQLAERLQSSGTVRGIGPCTGPLARHRGLSPAAREAVADADVVHIHGLWEEVQHQAATAARGARVPYIFRPCGMLDPWSLNQSRWKKRLYMALRLRRNLSHAAALHFTTAMEQAQVASLHLPPPGIVEPNGVDLREFEGVTRDGALRRQILGPDGRGTIISFLGRIHPGKGVEYLIRALSRPPCRDIHLLIIGPDSEGYRSKMESLAAQCGMAARIHFKGLLSGAEKISTLAQADLFCLPSEHENFGIAVVEALAAGLPVIISDRVGLRDDVISGGVGAVVPLDEHGTALASEIERWVGDDALRAAASGRASVFARERYDWLSIAGRWNGHYGCLLRLSHSERTAYS